MSDYTEDHLIAQGKELETEIAGPPCHEGMVCSPQGVI